MYLKFWVPFRSKAHMLVLMSLLSLDCGCTKVRLHEILYIRSYSFSPLIEILSGKSCEQKWGFTGVITGVRSIIKSIQREVRRSIVYIITMVDPRHGSKRSASGEIENIDHPYRVAHAHLFWQFWFRWYIHIIYIIQSHILTKSSLFSLDHDR